MQSARKGLHSILCMSGHIVTEELKSIEQKFGIELGHVPRASQQSATEYYPQFEQTVRTEAAQMAQHYELFYCLDKPSGSLSLRLWRKRFGANWWEEKVPQQIRDEVKRLVKNEVDSGITRRSDKVALRELQI